MKVQRREGRGKREKTKGNREERGMRKESSEKQEMRIEK